MYSFNYERPTSQSQAQSLLKAGGQALAGGQTLLASMKLRRRLKVGLFFTGAMGRFQLVRTHQDWRNRGLCRQLLSQVARQGFERARQLIIVADEHYHAQRVYRALGFVPVARIGSLCRWTHQP